MAAPATTASAQAKPGARNEPQGDKKVANGSETRNIGKGTGVTIGLVLVIGGLIWFAATGYSQIQTNTRDIVALRTETREELKDIKDGIRRLELNAGTLPATKKGKP